MYKRIPHDRYKITLDFLQKHLPAPARILDLGVENPFTEIMREAGYEVVNTGGEDLDFNYDAVTQGGFDALTAFEIIEHLVSPLPLLHAAAPKKLFATIPTDLWFAKAYWSESDPRDRHYHEFEPRQFDMLIEKAKWKTKDTIRWKNPPKSFGLRSMLRYVTPRYYGVYAER